MRKVARIRRVMTELVKEPGKYSLRALSKRSAEGKALAAKANGVVVVTKDARGATIRAIRAETRNLVSSWIVSASVQGAVVSDGRSCDDVTDEDNGT